MIKSAYIHIPFCTNICSYCDFCKMYYNKNLVDKYLDSLEKEIINNYKFELLDTIYIGGGTPSSLDIEELTKLFNILDILKLNNKYEYTIECNIENITEEKLILFKNNKINRISIGIQSFNQNNLNFLERKYDKEEIIEKINLTKLYFSNINVDLIYALPNETIEVLENDIKELIKLDVPHISSYSLIIEDHTKLKVKKTEYIDEDLDRLMYEKIIDELKNNNYIHYEISNFSKENYQSIHNLTYWNNDQYYGFGLGASGYIDNIRYTNTRSINKYIENNNIKEIDTIDNNTKIEYELILGFRKINGINKDIFYKKYSKSIYDCYNINKLLNEGKLIDEFNHIKIKEDYIYVSNSILIDLIE